MTVVAVACRKKLSKRAEELETLQKERDRGFTLITALTAEKEKLAAALAAAQARLRKMGQEAAAVAPTPKVDASKVRVCVQQVMQCSSSSQLLLSRWFSGSDAACPTVFMHCLLYCVEAAVGCAGVICHLTNS